MQDRLFDELKRQMDAKGLMLKQGTLIDATVIEAAPKKPPASDFDLGKGHLLKKNAFWCSLNRCLRLTQRS